MTTTALQWISRWRTSNYRCRKKSWRGWTGRNISVISQSLWTQCQRRAPEDTNLSFSKTVVPQSSRNTSIIPWKPASSIKSCILVSLISWEGWCFTAPKFWRRAAACSAIFRTDSARTEAAENR